MTFSGRRVIVTALLLLVASALSPVAAQAAAGHDRAAAGATVDVVDMAFSRPSVTVPVGGTVTWRFGDPKAHSSTSDSGFWDSGLQSSGDTWSRAFTSAGSFGYFCTTHEDMRGRVQVRPTASGTPTAGYTVRWASKRTSGTAVDVLVRTGSGRWQTWLANTSSLSGRFDRAGVATWQIRARTRNTTTRAVSGWSPAVKVAVR
jgi:plastocyanin